MTTILPTRSLGRNGPQVTALGFGLMGMSAFYGPPMKDEDAFPLLDHAIELGCTFWDTSNIYGGNEETLGRYFKARPGAREKIFLATKFGAGYDTESGKFTERGEPEYVAQCAETSLARLGVSHIDLYYIHRVDRRTPIEVTMKALVQLKEQGKIHHIGISEASSDTLRRAHAVHPLAAHQVEYSPFELSIEHEDIQVLRTCKELGIAVVAYSPLGRGMITGKIRSADEFDPTDFRRTLPRFQPDTFPKNLAIVDTIGEIAKRHNATAGQLALAWLLAQGNEVIPIPGTTRAVALEENVRALDIKLSANELEELNKIIHEADVLGDRYGDNMIHQVYADTVSLSQ